jgi:hypothetical protein
MSALGRIGRLIGVEAAKARGGWTLRVGLLAVAALTALAAWLRRPGPEESAWIVTTSALSAGLWVAEVFVLVAATTAIAGESAGGTLKMVLPHAYRRSDWIFAKAIVLGIQALALLAVAVLVAVVGGMLSGGLGDVRQNIGLPGFPEEWKTLHSAGEMTTRLGTGVGSAVAALGATVCLGLLVSCLFDAVVPPLSLGFLLFVGMRSAEALFGAGPEILEWLYAWYPGEMLELTGKMGRGLAETWKSTLFPDGLRLAGGVAAVSLLLSLAVFTRRDLHS